jgi:hypothetical protein
MTKFTGKVETYRGCGIYDFGDYYLLAEEDEWDYIQLPFVSLPQARTFIDGMRAGQPVACPTQDPSFHQRLPVPVEVNVHVSVIC